MYNKMEEDLKKCMKKYWKKRIKKGLKKGVKKYFKKRTKEYLEERLEKDLEKELKKNHGSKVKKGLYEDCKITLIGTKACICIGEKDYLELTDENVRKITFIKEKQKINHTYYYYEIEFCDGRSSYVRMRKKYKDAMFTHCNCAKV